MPPEANTSRAVVFDLDDTLFPERSYVRSGYHAVGEHLRASLSADEAYENWLWERFEAGERANAFGALSEQFNLHLNDADIANLVRVYRSHRPTIQPYDGVSDFLRALRGQYRLGLLSDGFLPAQRHKLDALGIADLFDVVLFTEDMGRDCWKPSPAGFEAVHRKLAMPNEGCTYVADNPAKDFVAPNQLDWRTIQLLWRGQIHASNAAPEGGRPQVVAAGLGELADALNA